LIQNLGRFRQAVLRLEQPRQRFERARVLRIALEHRAIGLDRAFAIPEPRVVHLAQANLEGELGRDVTAVLGTADLRGEQIGQVFVALGLLV